MRRLSGRSYGDLSSRTELLYDVRRDGGVQTYGRVAVEPWIFFPVSPGLSGVEDVSPTSRANDEWQLYPALNHSAQVCLPPGSLRKYDLTPPKRLRAIGGSVKVKKVSSRWDEESIHHDAARPARNLRWTC